LDLVRTFAGVLSSVTGVCNNTMGHKGNDDACMHVSHVTVAWPDDLDLDEAVDEHNKYSRCTWQYGR
jgi:hypothetical protein